MGDTALAAHICVECKLDLTVFSFYDNRGVFGKQGYQCQGKWNLFFSFCLLPQLPKHTSGSYESVIEWLSCLFFSVYLCGAQTMPPAGRHCVSTHEENSKRTGNGNFTTH